MTVPERSDRGRSGPLWLYSLAWWLATPALLGSLVWRGVRQPGYLLSVAERFGYCRTRGGTQRLIWLHAVSVGETRAAEPLLRAIAARWPDAAILLTHMTPTGRATGAAIFADLITSGRLEQCWLPWDYPGATRRMLKRMRPSIGMLLETELWPNLIDAAAREAVPMVLVSARLSEKSLRKGLRWHALIEPALLGLRQVLAQTSSDAERLAQLGRRDVPALGNLKFDIEPPESMLTLGGQWRECLLSREPSKKVIVAASTREGEEAMLFDAWRQRFGLERSDARPLLVVVPRHPQRFGEVHALAQGLGWKVARRSEFAGAAPDVEALDADVLIGDSMGEMFAWYAFADLAIIGGSFAPLGGQNLIEACAVGRPVIVGPHMFNFEEISRDAIAAGAAVRAADMTQAVKQSLDLLADEPRRHAKSQAAKSFAAQHRGATQRMLDSIAGVLE
jgi:3-deoxy-D-manno-octulosonic-acid transferase